MTLPEHYREPVTLCDLEGKTYIEAVDAARMSGGNGQVKAEPRAVHIAGETTAEPFGS